VRKGDGGRMCELRFWRTLEERCGRRCERRYTPTYFTDGMFIPSAELTADRDTNIDAIALFQMADLFYSSVLVRGRHVLWLCMLTAVGMRNISSTRI
jgi:hypothetical protein